MIKNITITGVKYELNDTTKKYVERKIGGLGKYLPRHARKSATADVKIKKFVFVLGSFPGLNKFFPSSVPSDQLLCFPEPFTPSKGFS